MPDDAKTSNERAQAVPSSCMTCLLGLGSLATGIAGNILAAGARNLAQANCHVAAI